MRDSWRESLGRAGAGDDFAVLNVTFDHPVTVPTTKYTTIDASLA